MARVPAGRQKRSPIMKSRRPEISPVCWLGGVSFVPTGLLAFGGAITGDKSPAYSLCVPDGTQAACEWRRPKLAKRLGQRSCRDKCVPKPEFGYEGREAKKKGAR